MYEAKRNSHEQIVLLSCRFFCLYGSRDHVLVYFFWKSRGFQKFLVNIKGIFSEPSGLQHTDLACCNSVENVCLKHLNRDFSFFSLCGGAFDRTSLKTFGKRPNASSFQRFFGTYFFHLSFGPRRAASTDPLSALPPSQCMRLCSRPHLVWKRFNHSFEKLN